MTKGISIMKTYSLELTATEVTYLRLALESLEDDLAPWDYDEGDYDRLTDMIKKLKSFEQRVVTPH